MSWLHDTGFGPALDHEGGVARVAEAGTDLSTPPDQVGPRVIGWRSSCQCGWWGTEFFLRSEWRNSEYAVAPEEVEERCKAEWERHLRAALPVLAIHDFTKQVTYAQENLVEAVRAARSAGIAWVVIGDAAGVTGECARERWSEAPRPQRPAGQARRLPGPST